MKKNSLLKKILSVVLSIGIAVAPIGILSACKQKKKPANTSSIEQVLPSNPSSGSSSSSVNSGTTIVETKIDVATIVNDYFANKNFESDFDSSLVNLVSKKVNIEEVKDIEVINFNKATNGSIVLKVTYDEGAVNQTEELTYTGDTTKFETFYNMSLNSSAVINGVIADNGLTLSGQVVEDSSAHTELKADFAQLLTKYNAEKAAFESISADKLTITSQTPVEYVTVQSIVDEVFAGIDFDANLKESAQALASTVNSNNVVNKLHIVDIKQGMLSFLVEEYNTLYETTSIRSFEVPVGDSSLTNYCNLSFDFDASINNYLASQNLTLSSNIDKNASLYTTLVENLTTLKQNYLSEKVVLDSTAKTNISRPTLFNAEVLSSEKMQEFGITSTNAFAEALLNNTKGQGYDQVTGWTMDDVVATYVGEFSGEGISYGSSVNFLVITKDSVLNYEMWTQRSAGDTTDRYSMILSNNPNTGVTSVTTSAEFSENAVVFNQDGTRVTEQTIEPMAFYMGNKIVGFYDKKNNITRLL